MEIVTENLWNCDGKLSVTISFVTNVIVTDPSQFVTDNCDGKSSVTFFCDGKIVTDFFHHNPFVTEVVTEGPSQFSKGNSTAEGYFCDERKNCDGLVTFRHKLWRNGESPSQIVTENVTDVRHNSLFETEFRHKFRHNVFKGPKKYEVFEAFQLT